jgi:cystathionine beta-lyase
MKYDFTSILDRKGKDAIAVDMVGAPGAPYPAPREGFDVIPMWVADMNFPVVPTIQEAMIARAQQPTFGYFRPRQEYTQAIIDWQKDHNGADVAPENSYNINITTQRRLCHEI